MRAIQRSRPLFLQIPLAHLVIPSTPSALGKTSPCTVGVYPRDSAFQPSRLSSNSSIYLATDLNLDS